MWLYFCFPFVFSVGHLYIIVLSSVFSLRQSRKTLINTWRSGWRELGPESLDLTTIVSWTTAILPNQLHSNEPLSLMILSAEQSPDQCECYSRMVIRFAPMSLNCTQTYTNTFASHLRLRFNQTYFPVEPRLLRLICWSVVFFLLLNVGGWTRIEKIFLFSIRFFRNNMIFVSTWDYRSYHSKNHFYPSQVDPDDLGDDTEPVNFSV